jgi:hypothetical protein
MFILQKNEIKGERKTLNMKIYALVAIIVLATMMFSPILTPVKASPAFMNTLQYRYFSDQNTLFTALFVPDSSGGVDTMQWPLTANEYQSAINNPAVTVEPLHEAAEYELAFNNNVTDGVPANMAIPIPRDPMNFTDFRNAMNLLVNKQAVIYGFKLQGFATQCDTQVPYPLEEAYVNTAVSGVNYPWTFNPTRALTILWTDGWYSHAVYPTLQNLLDVYAAGGLNGNLTGSGTLYIPYTGNVNTVVYPSLPGGDINGQWGGGDPLATADVAFAGQAIQPLAGYIRSNDARLDLGNDFCAELKAIGCPFGEGLFPTLTALRPYVLAKQQYDFATLGYSFGAPPNWWYSELTPAGIYPNGPNPYLVDDANTTKYATEAFTDLTQASFLVDEEIVQYNLVMESYLVPCYCPATYCAYKTGLLGQIDILGQGTEANGAQWENWITLDSRKSGALGNTINYNGPVSNTPDSNILFIGLYNPPDMINPIFQDTVCDFQVSDEIFTYPMATNPYTIAVGSALTGFPQGGDLPWMAYSWKTQLVNDPYNSLNPQWTNVTLWLRNDITWQDGVPFTDLDLNYTVYINSLYGDAYDNSAMIYASNVAKTGTPDAAYQALPGSPNYAQPYFTQNPSAPDPSGLYCCSILVSTPSWLNLYLPLYQIVPQHLYKYIQPSSLIDAENGASTDGLHGLWPGQSPSNTPSNFLPAGAGVGITYANVANPITGVPDYTLIGTGPFAYRAGSMTNPIVPGEGITLDEYRKFFMTVPVGAIAFQYHWLDTNPNDQPSGGYYWIGLADLQYFANACWKTTGTPPSTVLISSVPGNPGTWNPAADLAPPAGVIGLTDLVTMVMRWGWYYGNYTTALGQSLPRAWPSNEPNPPYGGP